MANNKKTIMMVFLVLTCLAAFPSALDSADYDNSIKEIRFNTYDNFTRIVIECENTVTFTQNLIKSPDRLYFDLKHTGPSIYNRQKIIIDDTAVKTLKVGRYRPGTTRVVLELKSYNDFNVYTLQNPDRLVVEVNSGDKPQDFIPRRRVIVIDAGHGGRDPGAIGRKRLKEKDVVLDIAKKLRYMLETKYDVEVYLTRKYDDYLELEDRALFANEKRADLFVSIHADANKKRRAKGISTWFLNYTNNEEYQKVAARENAISLEKQKESRTIGERILTSLATEFKRDESLRLAHYVQKSLIKNLNAKYRKKIVDLGVKYAFFYVLHTNSPSVLVEVGFITNPAEARMLGNSSYRKNIAYSIAKGINSYLSTLPDTPKLAGR